MNLALTELQQVALRDALVTTGINSWQVDDIFLLLSFKRGRVQLAFYYRAHGFTYKDIGELLFMSKQAAFKMVQEECENIAIYLRNPVDFW